MFVLHDHFTLQLDALAIKREKARKSEKENMEDTERESEILSVKDAVP